MAVLREGMVAVDGVRLHYYRTGPAERPTLVLAHGFTDNGRCWLPVVEVLANQYDAVMYDVRGHGQSDAPEMDYSYPSQAADLAGLIDALDLQQPTVLGHSMGAATALTLAATRPALVRAILLEDPPLFPPSFEPSLEERQAWQRETQADIRQRRHKPLEALRAQCREEHPTWREGECEPWAESKQQVSPNAAALRLNPPVPWRDLFPRVTCPILLITGDPEASAIVTPELAAEISTLWHTGQLVQIPDAGHSIRRERFDAYMQTVTGFLDTLYPA